MGDTPTPKRLARAEASNSTGKVTSWNSSTPENRIAPTATIFELAKIRPPIITSIPMFEPMPAVGTRAERSFRA